MNTDVVTNEVTTKDTSPMSIGEYVALNPHDDPAFMEIPRLIEWFDSASQGYDKYYLMGAVTARIVLIAQGSLEEASQLIELIKSPELKGACQSALQVGVMLYK